MKVWEKELFGRKLRLEYGKVAKQSLGSVVLTYNQSTIMPKDPIYYISSH